MSWEKLIAQDNLCGGGKLASIVFCCDPRKKECIYRDEALKRLGISKEKFIEIKDEMAKEAEEVCYGNLAYCCSLNSPCELRDKALRRLGMTNADYLKYKYAILVKLLDGDKAKIERAFKESLLRKFVFNMVDISSMGKDEPEGFKGIALGCPELTDFLIVLDIVPTNPKISEDVRKTLAKERFVGFRLNKELYMELEIIAKSNSCSISDVLREAVELYVKAHGRGKAVAEGINENFIKE